jgi:hypothetical protein
MDPLTSAWRLDNLFCQCDTCRDTIDLVTYVRRSPGRVTLCRLEPTQDALVCGGVLTHRPGHCGGLLTPYGTPEALLLQDCRRGV